MKPKAGEVWLVETCFCTAERVLVHSRSRFWSWLFRKPQYWVNQGKGLKWLEHEDVFLSRKESL